MSKDPTLYADQILEAITNIYTDINGKDLQSFCADRRIRQLVERNLEILSEASRRLPDEFKQRESAMFYDMITIKAPRRSYGKYAVKT